MDDELYTELEKLPKGNNVEVALEEHLYLASCLKIGLSIQDLQELEYKDVAKIMICYMNSNSNSNENENIRKATQNDWDRLAGR